MMRWAALAATALCLAACTASGEMAAGSALERYRPAGPSPWRLTFGDPVLADLLRRADGDALDVKIALARLEGARAALGLADAQSGLIVTADAAAALGQRGHLREGAALPVSAQIELDIWGRLKRAGEAAASDRDAAAADAEWARLVVAAAVTSAYVDLRTAQALYGFAETRAGLARRGDGQTRARASEGLARSAEFNERAKSLLTANEALRIAERDVQRQKSRLAALLGTTDLLADTIRTTTFGLSSPGPSQVSSELVTARPDVKAAFARLQSADAHRAEAVAAARPRLVLTASGGGADPAISDLLNVTSLAWALAANLGGPLFDSGASAANVAVAATEADIADLAYRRAVVTAWSEQREALLDVADAEDDVTAREAASALAKAARQRNADRSAEGLSGEIDAIDLEDAQWASTAEAATARARLAHAMVAMTLACGGAQP